MVPMQTINDAGKPINCQGKNSFYIAEVLEKFINCAFFLCIKLKSTDFCQQLTQNHHIGSTTPPIERKTNNNNNMQD
jgi:hypothetical protein